MEKDLLNEIIQLSQALNSKIELMEFQIKELKLRPAIQDWIDEDMVKKMTGLSKSTLYNLRKTGKLTSSKLSERKLFYRVSDLSRLLDHNEKA